MQQFILIEGDPVDGFTFTGPFSAKEAEEVRNTYNRDGWVAPLETPIVDHRGMWGEISEAIDAEEVDADMEMGDLDAVDGERRSMSVLDLIVKAEQGELDSAVEYGAYIWTLVSSGLVDSTGSNQRAVAAYAYDYGDDWKDVALEGFKSTFNGATTVYEAGL